MVSGDTHQSSLSEHGRRRAPIILSHEPTFHIGTAELLPATREVRFAGETSIIEPRVMQFLIALHRAGGAVVNKGDLLQSCWDGRIVGDDAINRVVSRLRVVATRAAGQQFRIETINKVGYRLLPAVSEPCEGADDGPCSAETVSYHRTAVSFRSAIMLSACLLAVILATAWSLRPLRTAEHSMMVRLPGFQTLSRDLPDTMRETINAEITAAFAADGVILVSTVPARPPGTAPAYALDGTIYRAGSFIRVITRLTDERSGVVLWTDSVDYPADHASKIPHKIAVDAGTVVRCGLSGAATYRKTLPDPVLSNYIQYCQQYWSYGGSKTLRFAQRVVAALPDFSWGWSAVGNGFMQAAAEERDIQRADSLRAAGRQAEDKALTLDPDNSEALAHKAYLIDPHDWAGQEKLFKSAIAAKPLDCGCEHFGYGLKLQSVGRLSAAIDQFHAATDMLALWSDSQFALARALVAVGHTEQANAYFKAGIDLSKDLNSGENIAVSEGVESGNYAAAITALRSPQFHISDEGRSALLEGYVALSSGRTLSRMQAVRRLLELPEDEQSETIATMLGALSANHAALEMAAKRPWLFWRRSMRGVLNEPAFPTVAGQLGLMNYWRMSHTKPDVCLTQAKAAFCHLI